MKTVLKAAISILFVLVFISACKKDDKQMVSFRDFQIPTTVNELYTGNQILSQDTVMEGTVVCVDYTIGASANNTEFLLRDNTDLFVGQIFANEGGITNGTFPPLIGGNRRTMPITFRGPVVNQVTFDMANPSIHEYNDIVNTYRQQEYKVAGDLNVAYRIIDVYSMEQLKLEMGGELKLGLFGKISGAFNRENFSEGSYFVVEIVHKHLSVHASLPSSPEELYNEMPDLSGLGVQSPVVLSTITYGRAGYFILKSSENREKTKIALDAGFKFWGKASLDLNLDRQHEQVLNEMSIDALIIGGDQGLGLATISGVQGITNFIKRGFVDNTSFGEPLSMKFKYVADFSVARSVSNLEYSYRECDIVPDEFNVTIYGNDPKLKLLYPKVPISYGDDRETGGNNIETTADIRLSISSDSKQLRLRTIYKVEETDETPGNGDYSVGKLDDLDVIYTAPEGFVIKAIMSDESTYKKYRPADDDHTPDHFSMGEKELARKLILRSDTPGDDFPDASNTKPNPDDYAYIKVEFNDITIRLQAE